MAKSTSPAKDIDTLEKASRRFLDDNPEAKEILELFGISVEQYQRFLSAQQKPVVFNTGSTI